MSPTPTDTAEIVALTHAYCWALDTHEWDELDDIFTADAVATLGSELRGIDEIKQRVTSALVPVHASQHMVNTHQISVSADGQRAISRCYLIAQHVRFIDQVEQHFLVAGRYDDELLRTVDGWRIATRSLSVIWTEGNPAVLQL